MCATYTHSNARTVNKVLYYYRHHNESHFYQGFARISSLWDYVTRGM